MWFRIHHLDVVGSGSTRCRGRSSSLTQHFLGSQGRHDQYITGVIPPKKVSNNYQNGHSPNQTGDFINPSLTWWRMCLRWSNQWWKIHGLDQLTRPCRAANAMWRSKGRWSLALREYILGPLLEEAWWNTAPIDSCLDTGKIYAVYTWPYLG